MSKFIVKVKKKKKNKKKKNKKQTRKQVSFFMTRHFSVPPYFQAARDFVRFPTERYVYGFS